MKKIYLVAAVIALVAGFATYFFASELKTSKIVTGVDEATVLVAIEDIDENTIVTKDMFQAVKLPQTAVPYGTVSDINDVIGYMTVQKILRGEQLMSRMVVEIGEREADPQKNSQNSRLSYEFGNGMYAFTLTVSKDDAVSYFIKEYDKVNIYGGISASAEPDVSNVTVIKISDYPANIQQDGGTEITSYMDIVLLVNKEQISKLLAMNSDSMRVVLVSYEEAYGLSDDIANASVPESRNEVPVTNYGMGEITTAPPTTVKK